MEFQFDVVFKRGPKEVARISGMINPNLTLKDLTENTIRTENFLERLTGLRVHIEQVK